MLVFSIAGLGMAQQTNPDNGRPISWKKLVPNILNDQYRIWTYPAALAEGRNWIPPLAAIGTTAGLAWGADPPAAHYFRNTATFSGFNNVFTTTATNVGILMAPVSLYAAGLIRHDRKMSDTALLAGEAAADAEIMVEVFKPTFDRLRPSALPPNSGFHDTWEEGGSRFSSSHNSFPSGHAIAAFSVATVVARRYGNHRWAPYAAYGAAGLVAFSRLTLSAHFIADVFAGGILGYSISRFAVLRP